MAQVYGFNRALKNLFSSAVAARESDIHQVICHNDFRKGYDPKNKIELLEEDAKKPKTTLQLIQEVKDGIKIMIETLADSELQVLLTKIYKERKKEGLEFLQRMMDGIVNEDYSFIDSELEDIN